MEDQTPNVMNAAFTAALADVITAPVIEIRAIVDLLEKKGILTTEEWQAAKRAVPTEQAIAQSASLARLVQKRILFHVENMKRQGGPVQ
jgi:hypothetical protein